MKHFTYMLITILLLQMSCNRAQDTVQPTVVEVEQNGNTKDSSETDSGDVDYSEVKEISIPSLEIPIEIVNGKGLVEIDMPELPIDRSVVILQSGEIVIVSTDTNHIHQITYSGGSIKSMKYSESGTLLFVSETVSSEDGEIENYTAIQRLHRINFLNKAHQVIYEKDIELDSNGDSTERIWILGIHPLNPDDFLIYTNNQCFFVSNEKTHELVYQPMTQGEFPSNVTWGDSSFFIEFRPYEGIVYRVFNKTDHGPMESPLTSNNIMFSYGSWNETIGYTEDGLVVVNRMAHGDMDYSGSVEVSNPVTAEVISSFETLDSRRIFMRGPTIYSVVDPFSKEWPMISNRDNSSDAYLYRIDPPDVSSEVMGYSWIPPGVSLYGNKPLVADSQDLFVFYGFNSDRSEGTYLLLYDQTEKETTLLEVERPVYALLERLDG